MKEWRRVVRGDLAAATGTATATAGGGGGGGGADGDRRHGGGEGGAASSASSAWVEESGGYLSLPEVEISGAEEFMEAFVNRSRPAVIKVKGGDGDRGGGGCDAVQTVFVVWIVHRYLLYGSFS